MFYEWAWSAVFQQTVPVSFHELIVAFYLLLESFLVNSCIRMKNVDRDFAGGSAPVADDLAVQKDDRPEDAAAVVGPVTVVRMKRHLPALVADKILVIRSEQMDTAAAKSTSAAIHMRV